MRRLPGLAIIAIAFFAIVAVATLALAAHDAPSKSATDKAAWSDNTPSTQSPTSTSDSNSSNTPSSQSGGATSSGASQNQAASATVSDACKVLTTSIAQQIIGTTAKEQAATDSVTATKDTQVDSCAYAAGSKTVQLTVRSSKNSLGTSENATAFGSERPAGAVTVSGYGQSAYWDPAKHTLNVLSSNNWYVISRDTNVQADCEAVAALIKEL